MTPNETKNKILELVGQAGSLTKAQIVAEMVKGRGKASKSEAARVAQFINEMFTAKDLVEVEQTEDGNRIYGVRA